jgi:hypothetical protein
MPTRTRCAPCWRSRSGAADGAFVLTDAPGIGVEPDLAALERARRPL